MAFRESQFYALSTTSLHTSTIIRAARPGLARRGIYLYFLPACSPELNEIEPVFRQVKYHEIPERSHTTRLGLREVVEAGFTGLWPAAAAQTSRKTTSGCLARLLQTCRRRGHDILQVLGELLRYGPGHVVDLLNDLSPAPTR